ncbi:MAG: SEC-C domain-containing protein [Planctomycetaceae bacterium]|nr:SEC-C domain-containing protein [Planctomycetaceae bacterium]
MHVFDAVTLDVILRELDTISDFVRYLTRKERFIRAGKLAQAAGEENLLACYVTTMTEDGHDFVLPDGYEMLVVQDGHWRRHIHSPEFGRKVDANRKSYVWDQLIEEFCRHTIEGTSLEGSTVSIADAESGYRIMAREPRLNRRLLADAWVDRLATASTVKISVRTVLSEESSDTGYVFATMPESIEDTDRYRRYRRGYLDKYCFVLAWKYRFKRVVGIASEPGLEPFRSHDFMLFEPDEWTEQMEEDAQRTQESLGILYEQNLHKTPVHQDEYPAAKTRPKTITSRPHAVHPPFHRTMSKIGRNEPCPCGSGKKFKKCCGQN